MGLTLSQKLRFRRNHSLWRYRQGRFWRFGVLTDESAFLTRGLRALSMTVTLRGQTRRPETAADGRDDASSSR